MEGNGMPVCFELSIAQTLDVIKLRPGLDGLCNVTTSGAVALKGLAVLDWFPIAWLYLLLQIDCN